jgi:hypothetical protein
MNIVTQEQQRVQCKVIKDPGETVEFCSVKSGTEK